VLLVNTGCVSVRFPENLSRRCTLALSRGGGETAYAEGGAKLATMRQTSGNFTVSYRRMPDQDSFASISVETFCRNLYKVYRVEDRRKFPNFPLNSTGAAYGR
jgi:hypothetical protein